jgi:hypothetical protein
MSGDVARQDQRFIQLSREALGCHLAELDDLHFVFALDRLGEPAPDIAAAADHHALDRFVHAPQLAHYAADVFGGSDEKHLIAGFDHGLAFRDDRAVLAENRCHPRFRLRHVLPEILHLVSDQRAAMESAHRDQAHLAAGELEHLQRLRELEELGDVIRDDLLRADRQVDGEIFRREDFRVGEIVSGTDARDLGRDIEHGGGELARHHVGFVALRDREQHVGITRSGLFEDRRMGRVSAHGAQVESVLKRLQPGGVRVDDRDVVRLGHQVFSHRRAHLPSAENDNLQVGLREECAILFRLYARG